MEAAKRSGRPGQEALGGRGHSHRNYKGMPSEENLCFAEKGEDPGSPESQRKDGIRETREGSRSTGASTRQSQVAQGSRHKRLRSPDGSSDNDHSENGLWQGKEQGRGRPSSAQKRREDQADCAREGPREGRPGRRGAAARSPWRLKGRRTRPRSPVRTAGRGRRPDGREARPASPKRRRGHLGPEARDPLAAVTTRRLWQRVGALEVALDELRAPGGAFLPGPTRHTRPSASQRAWLSWQLAHAGAALHWAAARLHALLAAQPGP